MVNTKQPNEQIQVAADTIEQLELANQALETAKLHMEEAQNVLHDTKEALVKTVGGEGAAEAETQSALEAAQESLLKKLSGTSSHDGSVLQ